MKNDVFEVRDRVFFTSSVLLLSVPGAGPVKQEVNGDGQEQSWELKKVSLPLTSSPALP